MATITNALNIAVTVAEVFSLGGAIAYGLDIVDGKFDGYNKINLINSIIIALGMILALILVLSRVYRKYFYRDDDD
ncbi:putative bacteriocin [Streptococcus pneumoniae]|nr:putative bacteriocin [Streptococcus pneumoniae]VRF31643.1 putative bacteriocin [Streptococcus pneumoniae]